MPAVVITYFYNYAQCWSFFFHSNHFCKCSFLDDDQLLFIREIVSSQHTLARPTLVHFRGSRSRYSYVFTIAAVSTGCLVYDQRYVWFSGRGAAFKNMDNKFFASVHICCTYLVSEVQTWQQTQQRLKDIGLIQSDVCVKSRKTLRTIESPMRDPENLKFIRKWYIVPDSYDHNLRNY